MSGIQGDINEEGDLRNDKVDAMGIVYTTFMNESDMKDTQLATINKAHYAA